MKGNLIRSTREEKNGEWTAAPHPVSLFPIEGAEVGASKQLWWFQPHTRAGEVGVQYSTSRVLSHSRHSWWRVARNFGLYEHLLLKAGFAWSQFTRFAPRRRYHSRENFSRQNNYLYLARSLVSWFITLGRHGINKLLLLNLLQARLVYLKRVNGFNV